MDFAQRDKLLLCISVNDCQLQIYGSVLVQDQNICLSLSVFFAPRFEPRLSEWVIT